MASKLKLAGTVAAILGLGAIAIVSPALDKFEGTVYVDYYDPLGIPTACDGHTGPDVTIGRKRSKAECDALKSTDIKHIWAGMTQCITNSDLTDNEKAAFISFAYNVGVTKFCGSTMLKLINADRVQDACHELPKWNQPTSLRGLAIRRAEEERMCLGEGQYGR